MALTNTELPTLLDHARKMDPDGRISPVIELLQTRNAFLQDAYVREGNLPTGHQVNTRTALPSVEWRKLNQGITPGKSRGAQVVETAGMLEGMLVVDVDVARLNGNDAAFIADETRAFAQALNKEAETAIAYHSTATAPEKIHGLIPRLDSTTGTFGTQVIKVTTSPSGADQASILFVGWGPDCFLFYPKGSRAGIETIDMGRQLWDDGSGGVVGKKFVANVTNWKWHFGLAIADGRQVVRIQYDTSAETPDLDTLAPAMIEATHRIQDPNGVRGVFYMNRTSFSLLHKQARSASKAASLTTENIGGRAVTSFLGFPVRVTDALTSTEANVA